MTAAGTTAALLPLELAPSLAARLRALLAEVPPAEPQPIVIDTFRRAPRCVLCYRGGKLGGHHNADGEIEWIHRKCHRRPHLRGRSHGHVVTNHRGTGQRVLQRRHTAC